MAWSHTWAAPGLLTIVGKGWRLMVPRQSCLACGTIRNPFNNVITHFPRFSVCRDLLEPPSCRDFSVELRDLDQLIASLERSGEPVDKWHTGRKRKSADVPTLRLPYKD